MGEELSTTQLHVSPAHKQPVVSLLVTHPQEIIQTHTRERLAADAHCRAVYNHIKQEENEVLNIWGTV